jgi:hypothetical protein
MEREEAYEADLGENPEEPKEGEPERLPIHYTFRHGDGSAGIIATELCDNKRRRVEIVETGTSLIASVTVRFQREVDEPVIGFLIRNRHGIHAYGTNTKEQNIQLGKVTPGQTVSITFAFNCWLGIDDYSISFAVHSLEGQAYDWVDGALFFKVTSQTLTEGIANLHATASVVTDDRKQIQPETQSVSYG